MVSFRASVDLSILTKSRAQDIYRTVFNNAYENHARNPIEEADAHNIAWAAVERSYVKEGGEWVLRGVPG